MKLVVALVLLSLAGQALSLGECELFQRSEHSIAGGWQWVQGLECVGGCCKGLPPRGMPPPPPSRCCMCTPPSKGSPHLPPLCAAPSRNTGHKCFSNPTVSSCGFFTRSNAGKFELSRHWLGLQ